MSIRNGDLIFDKADFLEYISLIKFPIVSAIVIRQSRAQFGLEPVSNKSHQELIGFQMAHEGSLFKLSYP